ncbi:polysaccharide biosynthesis tyrosine autokinase [Sporosarcina sp. Marseille-Q4063]|uniref:polysaccharide biosynthesis tyrosine autokinase n=1 Tax=Sporosarcina sp. Marseille-Q4063 TaxID=2810514 RepID=UPI001BB0BD1E|nr:polysaccharide biosynthesis tyrosine autokinase [Sporosarcina sp. Marseille-Q4063]QUW23298.1 polysaccharide biosynthesis tyrosine autokinase [Sporosarcina sp. Marseille-Q4063]
MKKEMGIKELVNLMLKKRSLVISIILFFTLVGSIVGFILPSTYEAKTDLLVNYTLKSEKAIDLQSSDIEMSLRLIETYKYMLKSDRMLTEVNLQLDEQYSKSELMKYISIESSNNSQIITIVAREKTREKAAILVNKYATTFQEEIKNLMSLENITILNNVSPNAGIKEITFPSYMLSVISFVIGVIVSIMTIVIREFYSPKLNTSTKTENVLSIPNLGIIPFVKVKKSFKKKYDQWDEKLISMMESPPILTEGFRRVRANVQYQMSQKNIKTILVTSPVHGDGKSFVSGNLAIIMAMDGKKTVFVDANLRQPIGRLVFNLPKRNGLTSHVSGHFKLNEIIQKTGTENLFFISSGPIPPNPAEVLSSPKMKDLIDELKNQFEVIIIDTPSLNVADTISLSMVVDGCIYVIDAEGTKDEQASKSLRQLQKVDAPILGTILNRSYSEEKQVAIE